jgi:hypothetical protein
MADSEVEVSVAEEDSEPVVAEPASESADGGEGQALTGGAKPRQPQAFSQICFLQVHVAVLIGQRP